VKNVAELAGVYAMFVVVLAKSNVSDFEALELFVIHLADDPRCRWLPPHKSLPSREALA
jgi:hypothetical protein